MIRFSCPACKSKLSAPEEKAGIKLPCPKCGQKLQIPSPPSPTSKTMLGEWEPNAPAPQSSPAPVAEELMTALPADVQASGPEPRYIAQTAKGSDDNVGEGWITLQVSARVLQWPNHCACCDGQAETVLPVSHTRVEGIKVVRSDTRSWDVPYCTRCLTHVRTYERSYQIQKDAEQRKENADRAAQEARGVGPSSVLLILTILSSVIAVTCVGTSLLGLLLSVTDRSGRGSDGAGAATGLVCVLLFGGLAGLFYFLHRNEQKNGEVRKKAAIERAENLRQDAANVALQAGGIFSQAEAGLSPNCALIFQAVVYRGWQGSIHTFLFRNVEYAKAFAEANSSKLLS